MPTFPKSPKRPWLKGKEGPSQGRQHPNQEFYNSTVWRKFRKSYIVKNPLCVKCQKKGLIVGAQILDHIQRINDGGDKFDLKNLQSLCKSCHNSKSGKEAHGYREHEHISDEEKKSKRKNERRDTQK